MKKIAVAMLFVLSMAGGAAASNARGADIDRIQSANIILTQIMSAPDSGIPDWIMGSAKCIAIVPSMLKASFVFGANYGKGVATCRTEKGWSAPVFFRVTGGSFGFQAGGQASDLVLIIRTQDGMQHLLQSKFKLGADASVAAGPVGRDAQAMTDLTLRAQVLTYSRSRGLFLGVSLSGGVIRQDDGDTRAFYGKDWTFYSVLNGEVPAPEPATGLLNTVEKYAPTRRAAVPAKPPVPAPVPEPTAKVQEPPVTTAAATPEQTNPASSDEQAEPAVTAPAATAPAAPASAPPPAPTGMADESNR